MISPPPLKHEIALLGEEEILAPELEKRCESDSQALEARRITEASRRRLLRCAVCGAMVKKVFGARKRWHFALFPGVAPCDHENETIEHREAKLALYRALKSRLSSAWSVLLEERLENGRRPDVLAVREDGVRMAFEVQFAELSGRDWKARHEDYAKIGVRDAWLLGHNREGRERDVLASALAATEGQRIVYVGKREGEESVRAEEAIFGSDLTMHAVPYSRPGSTAPDTFVAYWPGVRIARRIGYGLERIELLEDCSLRTPADRFYEGAVREAKREAERRRRRQQERDEQRLREIAQGFTNARKAEERKQWALRKREEEARAWHDSKRRARARELLGEEVLALLEEEGRFDKNIHAPPGRWKVDFFLSRVHGRPPGMVFDWFKAAGAILREYPHNSRNAQWTWRALNAFVDRLEDEYLVEFDHHDDRDMRRYFRVPSEPGRRERVQRELAEKERLKVERRREEERREATRLAELEEKWKRNREEREVQKRRVRSGEFVEEAYESMLQQIFQEERLARQERIGQWLGSGARTEARAELGQHLVNRLEREEDFDRSILAHPGEWKVSIFLDHVHTAKLGSRFDLDRAMSEVLAHFPMTISPAFAREAVRRFVRLLQAEGFLEEAKAAATSQENQVGLYTVACTAGEWTQRLEDRIRRISSC